MTKTIKATQLFKWTMKHREEDILLHVGGARSSKSYSVAQHLILNKILMEKKILILATRKTLPSLKLSSIELVLNLFDAYGIPYEYNKTEGDLSTVNGNRIIFKALDDAGKIMSTEFNYVWVEEPTEISYKEFLKIKTRMSRKNKKHHNQIYLTCNPIDINSWIYQKLVIGNMPSLAIKTSNYHDNPFLSKSYIRMLEELQGLDETYYKIYALGQWATPENLIFTHWKDVQVIRGKEKVYGLDFGYNHPTALIEVNLFDDEYYARELIYQSHLTSQDLITMMLELGVEDTAPIYADSSRPEMIEEIKEAGFNIHPAKKDVKQGIDFVKTSKLFIDENSTNLINELRGYKWKETKDGIILDEPVKFKDDAIDALRYAMYTYGRSNCADDDYDGMFSGNGINISGMRL